MWVATKLREFIWKNFWIKQKSFSRWTQSIASLLKNDAVLDMNTFYDLYRFNWDIRQCIRKIANAVARNWIYLEDNKRQLIDNNELTDDVLDLFKTPTFLKFKVDLYRNYMISWELYIIPVYNIQKVCIWFDVLDSRLVSKTCDAYWNITSFTASNWWVVKTYKPDEIAFFKFEDDVYDSTNWMWLLHGVVYDALSDLEAQRTNYYFYQNSAIPSAILMLDEWMSEEETQNAKDMFDAQFRWTNNQHKTLVAWWVKDIKTLSLSPRDMEFINQRHLTTDKVSATFGVAKFLLWYWEDANYNNWINFRKEFVEWTIKPLEQDFEHILNKLLEMFRPDLYELFRVRADWEQFDESQEWQDWLLKKVNSGVITINEARWELWLEKVDDENADKLITSKNMLLLEDIWLDAVLPLNEE